MSEEFSFSFINRETKEREVAEPAGFSEEKVKEMIRWLLNTDEALRHTDWHIPFQPRLVRRTNDVWSGIASPWEET